MRSRALSPAPPRPTTLIWSSGRRLAAGWRLISIIIEGMKWRSGETAVEGVDAAERCCRKKSQSEKGEPADELRKKSGTTHADLHGLGILDQADRGGELRVLERGGQTGHGLGVSNVDGQSERIFGELLDPFEQRTTSGDLHAGAQKTKMRAIAFELPFDQLKGFPDTTMNDRVEHL